MLSVEKINRLESENNMLKDSLSLANSIVNKYHAIIQEIKAIACGNYEIIDPQGRKDILKLITKAEEE